MDKSIKVYPIPTGNELNVFSTENMHEIKIMDLTGKIVYNAKFSFKKKNIINIRELPENTYIIEVGFADERSVRSIFVKI